MKESQLLFVQIDHVSGEVTGFAVGKLMELGAHNVQLIPTITKKNRPGNIIMVDADVEHEGEIARFLARELKISGYHKISTTHVFQKVSFHKKSLAVSVNGVKRSFPFEIKIIGDLSEPLSVDIEHDFLVHVQETLNTHVNYSISLSELRTIIESKLKEPGDEITVDI
jgi:Ni,Fe-hydrogenase maturation factor